MSYILGKVHHYMSSLLPRGQHKIHPKPYIEVLEKRGGGIVRKYYLPLAINIQMVMEETVKE